MKRAAVCALMILLVGCGKRDGVGQRTSEERDVSGFTAIEMRGSGTLFLSQGDKESLRIEAGDKIIGYITSTVSGETLELAIHPDAGQLVGQVDYYVTAKRLKEIQIDGASSLISKTPFKAKAFALDVHGSSAANLDIDVQQLELEIAGAGDVTAQGRATNQKIEINGAGKYEALKLASENAEVAINGVGRVSLNVAKKLDVEIKGGGAVLYEGSPEVRQKVAGAGRVEALKR